MTVSTSRFIYSRYLLLNYFLFWSAALAFKSTSWGTLPVIRRQSRLHQAHPLSAATTSPELDTSYESYFSQLAGYTDETFAKVNREDFDEDLEGIYGEILPSSIRALLQERLVKLDKGDVFYDLGSGTGKVVAQVAFETNCGRCVGIELGDNRAREASRTLSKLRKATEEEERGNLDFASRVAKIEFVHGDLLAYNWSDATVLFINAFCFPPSLMRAVEHKVKHDCPTLRFVFLFGQRFRHDMTMTIGDHYEHYLDRDAEDVELGSDQSSTEPWSFNLYEIPAPASWAEEVACQFYISHREFHR